MNLKDKWSKENWMEHAEKIEEFVLKHTNLEVLTSDFIPHGTEHRIEGAVRKIAHKLQDQRVHVGLTSSDLEDNIRIKTLNLCGFDISKTKRDFLKLFKTFILNNTEIACVGRTHLLPTQITTVGYRFAPAWESLASLEEPQARLKGLGGSVGHGYILHKLDIPLNASSIPSQITSNQTSNMLYESDFVFWCAKQASILSQVALNFRLMFMIGEAVQNYDEIGSSAVAGKAPNPFRWERVCGRARELVALTPVFLENIASNGLERTLDNQTNLHEICERVCVLIEQMYTDTTEALKRTSIDKDKIKENLKGVEKVLKSEDLQLELMRVQAFSRIRAQKVVHDYVQNNDDGIVEYIDPEEVVVDVDKIKQITKSKITELFNTYKI